jgi:hypothetical protein
LRTLAHRKIPPPLGGPKLLAQHAARRPRGVVLGWGEEHGVGGEPRAYYRTLLPTAVPNRESGLVLLDTVSEFLQDTLKPDQLARFVQASKELGEPKELEAADYQPSVDALRAAPPVSEIPAVVLSADKCWLTFPDEDAAEAEATCSAWLAAQDQLATVLDAKHITDTNRGYYIQGEQPQLVIHSVRKVVEAARKNACALGSNHGQCIKAEKHARP